MTGHGELHTSHAIINGVRGIRQRGFQVEHAGLRPCGSMKNLNPNLTLPLSEFRIVHVCHVMSPPRAPQKSGFVLDVYTQPANGLSEASDRDTALPSSPTSLSVCIRVLVSEAESHLGSHTLRVVPPTPLILSYAISLAWGLSV